MPIPAQPNTAAKNLIVTPLRGMGSAKVDLVRNGASVVVTVTFVAGLNYSGWSCYAEASAMNNNPPAFQVGEPFYSIAIPKTITTDGSGRRVVTLTFTPATFYGLSGLDFDNRFIVYPRSFRLECWHENVIGGMVYADLFLGGTVTLTTAQPNYIHSVNQA